MASPIRIGLVGDRRDDVTAHRAIPFALRRSAKDLGLTLEFDWLATPEITSAKDLHSFRGLWCVPASPYRSESGALLAIQHARENGIPFLGTCGGFQHALLEYARNVLGWADADHAETNPTSTRAVIAPLLCSLVEVTGVLHFQPGSRLAQAYGTETTTEAYHCRYGINPELQAELLRGTLRIAAVDDLKAVRAVELTDHPFFIGTLFQPERAALEERPVLLVDAFLRACV